MKLNEKFLTELKLTLDEIDDPIAVVAFIISETDDDDQQVKVIASIPTGSAPEVRQVISEAMDRVVETRSQPHDVMPFEDKLALSLCETFYDELPEKQQALWDFNEDALDLCDALVSANLCRDAIHDWYWPFRSYMDNKPIEFTPALTSFVKRGPEGSAQEIAALWTVAVCHLIPVDHDDPPAVIPDGIDDAATHCVASFFETIARQSESH